MEFIQYIRKPFGVEAVEITDENIDEIAALIGKIKINEATEVAFIALDRRIIPNVGRAYIGWWLTRLGDNYRCYAPKVFSEQFMVQECNPVTFDIGDVNVTSEEDHSRNVFDQAVQDPTPKAVSVLDSVTPSAS